MQTALHQSTPAELRERLAAERSGSAFAVLRDGGGTQRILLLDAEAGTLTIGRARTAAIRVAWDREVSRIHAELEHVGGQWMVSDNGLSRNGTFVNGERVRGRRRLADGDRLTCGATELTFRSPPRPADDVHGTHTSAGKPEERPLSEAQRRVAAALCRPLGGDGTFGEAASNEEIAAELVLSVATVKTHLRALYRLYGIEDLQQNVKRRRLASLLVDAGAVEGYE